MDPRPWIGIDVAKAHLDVVTLPADTHRRVPNDADGWTTLAAQIPNGAGIVVEATGSYHRGVWLALEAAGHAVTVANPTTIHGFIISEGQRAKTDRHDARMLARFGQQKQPAPTPAPTEPVRRLQELVGCREDLVQTRVQTANRRKTATMPAVIAALDAMIAQARVELAGIEHAIADLIAGDPELTERQRLLTSTPGVGPVIGAALVAWLPELGTLNRVKIAGLAGVAPHPHDSGNSSKPRHIAGGRTPVRRALYQMAVTAVRWDPAMKAHDQQLRQRKPPKVALIAVARRMLGILTVMVRDGLTWQETRVGQGHYLAEAA